MSPRTAALKDFSLKRGGGECDRLQNRTTAPAPAAQRRPSADICGVKVNIISLNGLLDDAMARVEQRSPGYIVTPNVDHVCLCAKDPGFKSAYDGAFLSVPDGVPLLWGGRLLGTPLAGRLNGTDLVYAICERAATEGRSVFLLGAAEGIPGQAAERLRSLYPELRIAGTHSPPMGFEKSAADNAKIIALLHAAKPDLCFVALGSPKQEIWMSQYSEESLVPLMVGIGASLDFIAGNKRRAPRVFQKAGLEWFWRLCTEPRRLWRRYLVDDMLFFVLLARQYMERFSAPGRTPDVVVELEGDDTAR
jgi:N-acetylglucosaminyldiphosphoundecaprenol N-acetyl-beta-D-mannosaminyltransferase